MYIQKIEHIETRIDEDFAEVGMAPEGQPWTHGQCSGEDVFNASQSSAGQAENGVEFL